MGLWAKAKLPTCSALQRQQQQKKGTKEEQGHWPTTCCLSTHFWEDCDCSFGLTAKLGRLSAIRKFNERRKADRGRKEAPRGANNFRELPTLDLGNSSSWRERRRPKQHHASSWPSNALPSFVVFVLVEGGRGWGIQLRVWLPIAWKPGANCDVVTQLNPRRVPLRHPFRLIPQNATHTQECYVFG